MRHVAVPREVEGYAPLWISRTFLAQAEVRDGRLVVGDCSFGALLIDVEWLDGEALADIDRLAGTGLSVVLARLPRAPGKRPRGDYQALLDQLRTRSSVVGTLQEAHLAPLVAGDDIPPFWARRTAESLYLFFAHPKARELCYPMRYGQSHCPHAEARRVTIDFEGTLYSLDLVFEPNQSLVVRVSRANGVQFVDIAYRVPVPVCSV
jgi:hypothetical protein